METNSPFSDVAFCRDGCKCWCLSTHSGVCVSSPPQMEMSVGPAGVTRRTGTLKRTMWGGLRQQWKLLGLFEIDQQHEFYSLTSMMKEGLSAAVQNTIDNPPPVSTHRSLNVVQVNMRCILLSKSSHLFF